MTPNRSRLLIASLILLVPLAASAQEVRDREATQQQRISQGVASGQITARGAAGIENREARINASRRADLAAHGGHLTPAEYHRLNRRENAASRHIFIDKHNAVAQPGVVPQ